MSKILSFPHPTGWTPPFLGSTLSPGEEVRLVLALDPPVSLLRKLQEAQKELLEQVGAEVLSWVDPRDFIFPLLNLFGARAETLEAVVVRMRQGAQGNFCGKYRVAGLGWAPSGEARLWARVEDEGGTWKGLKESLTRALERDGFEPAGVDEPRIVLAEEQKPEPQDLSAALGRWESFDFGRFTGWDLVLYLRRPSPGGATYQALSYLPLDHSGK